MTSLNITIDSGADSLEKCFVDLCLSGVDIRAKAPFGEFLDPNEYGVVQGLCCAIPIERGNRSMAV